MVKKLIARQITSAKVWPLVHHLVKADLFMHEKI